MQSEKTTCDACGHDLSITKNCEDYRLTLTVERIPSVPGFVTLLAIDKPLKRDHHFCGLGCLGKWMKKHGLLPRDHAPTP